MTHESRGANGPVAMPNDANGRLSGRGAISRAPTDRGRLSAIWRVVLGLVGLALLGFSVWGEFHGKLDATTAALAAIGTVMVLCSLVGRVTSFKMGDLEVVLDKVAQGDDELALRLTQKALGETNPDAVAYVHRVEATVWITASRLGLSCRVITDVIGLNLVIGSKDADRPRVIGVDIRQGSNFEPNVVARTYRTLLNPEIPVVDAMLAVIWCRPDSPAVQALNAQLQDEAPHFSAVAWKTDNPDKEIRKALETFSGGEQDTSPTAAQAWDRTS